MLARADHAETDAGRSKAATGTERLCIATREVKPVADMIRFVIGPDGGVVPDLKRKLPGRGVWVTATRDALGEAIKKKAFARAFKREVKAAADLPDLVDRLIERAALDALSIAHKAGQVAIGFGKVEAALAHGPVAALIHAADGGEDGVRKLNAALRRTGENAEKVPVIGQFASAQLDLALGRANVIHAALLAGPAGEGFLGRCRSMERFRSVRPDAATRSNA